MASALPLVDGKAPETEAATLANEPRFVGPRQANNTPPAMLQSSPRPAQQNKLVIPQGTKVAVFLTGEVRGESKNPHIGRWLGRPGNRNTPSILVAQDVVIEGLTVIARGTPVEFMIGGEPPRRMSTPGRVVVEVVGVPSTTLDFVTLSAVLSATGEWRSCGGPDCAVGALAYGDPGKINSSLFDAYVTNDVTLNRDAVPPQPTTSPASGMSRLHLYQITSPQSGRRISFSLDGERVGTVDELQYACINVSPGNHMLRIERHEYVLDLAAQEEMYIRMVPQGKDLLVAATDGFQLSGAILQPGHLKPNRSAPCFDPPDDVAGVEDGRK